MMQGDHSQSHAALGLIQLNDHLDFDTPLQLLDDHYPVGGAYLSENLISVNDDGRAPSTTDNFAGPPEDFRPRKSQRRDHYKASTTLATTTDEHGMSMITLLLECAVAISADNLSDANRILLELTQVASPYAPSSAERVVAYFTKAMISRVINSWLGICTPLVIHKSILSAFQSFNNVSPFVKFSHFTSNQAILESFHQEQRVHIVDLDIMQGLQWPALFHILSTRPGGPPHVTMTGFGASASALDDTGRRLSSFARRLRLPFEFRPVAKRPGDVTDPSTVTPTRRGEAVAVHWLRHTLYDATGDDSNTMRVLEFLAPRVVTLVEQEVTHRGPFLDRFAAALHYYSAVFDSLGACLGVDDSSRYGVEHGIMLREIENILAIGGPARSGEEKFGSWRAAMARRGFVQVGMSGNAMAQAQLIVNMFQPGLGYGVEMEVDGSLRLGWKGTGLYNASKWMARSPNS
ncbi:protein SCARECROW-like [Typha angustifolia]|uniref:protein SCARECROW-like n=1 Tax=Typha angustifolia TaxID=59011 RepID=UPI003C2C95DE